MTLTLWIVHVRSRPVQISLPAHVTVLPCFISTLKITSDEHLREKGVETAENMSPQHGC